MNAQTIHAALAKMFPAPAHTLLSEVRNGTGFVRGPRTIDALVASTWPSRGLWLAGVEIKMYRGDWKRELAQPEKAEAIQRYCHYFYAAAPVGLIPHEEVPATWGLIEVDEKARGKVTVKPTKQEPQPMDCLFLFAILRNFAESYVPNCQVNELAEKKAADLEKHRGQELEHLKATIAEFSKASGVDLKDKWRYGEIGQAVNVVIESGILYRNDRLEALRMQAAGVVEACDKIEAALKPKDEWPEA